MINKEIINNCICCGSQSYHVLSDIIKVAQCCHCKVIFNFERPTQDYVCRNYDTYAHYNKFNPDDKWHKMWLDRYLRVKEFSLSLSRPKLLDIGAGIGTFLYVAQKDFDIEESEISEAAVKRAYELYRLSIYHGELEGANYQKNSFNVITMWHVFEHLPYPEKTLQLCRELLKPGGVLVLAVPNSSSLRFISNPRYWFKNKEERLKMRGLSISYEDQFQEIHLVHYTPNSLKNILENFGFEISEMGIDKTSLNPGWKTDLKFILRQSFVKLCGLNPWKTIFVAARLRK